MQQHEVRAAQERQLLILDVGPIREFITYQVVILDRLEHLRRELQFFRDESAILKYDRFLGSFKRRMTSPSVVAQLEDWVRERRNELSRRILWKRISEEFKERAVVEEGVPLVEMDIDLLARFGAVDVSLLQLARRHAAEQPVILTVDDELTGYCAKRGARARHIVDVLSADT